MYDLDSDFRDNGSFFKALRNFCGSWEFRFWATFYDSMGGSSLDGNMKYFIDEGKLKHRRGYWSV